MRISIGFSKTKLIFSLVLNAIALLVSLYVFTPFFEEIDDTHIAMISEGAYGTREWHLFFSNVILGKITVFFQTIMPLIRWHIVFQYVFIFIGYVASVYVISKHKRGIPASVIAVLSSFYEMYVSVQFTKTATFACLAGILLLFEYVRESTVIHGYEGKIIPDESCKSFERFVLWGIGILLVSYGIMLRHDGLFLAAVPACAVGVVELLRTRNIRKYLVVFVPVLALYFVLISINSVSYRKSQDWKNTPGHLNELVSLLDQRYDVLEYNKYGDTLNELGISENDAMVLLTCQYGDDSVFTDELLDKTVNAFPKRNISYEMFANLYENITNEVTKSYGMITGLGLVILILIITIISDRSKSSPGFIRDSEFKLVSMIIMGCVCAAALIFFQYKGRFSHRLVASIVVATVFAICYMLDDFRIRENDSAIVFGGNKRDFVFQIAICTYVILLACNYYHYRNDKNDYNYWKAINDPMIQTINELTKKKESYFVVDTFTVQNMYKYELFNSVEEGKFDNYITAGSWFCNSPVTKVPISKYGYTNPYDALRHVDDNVFLIDNMNVNNKTTFLSEHYDEQYDAEFVETKGGLDIYKIKLVDE